MAKFNYVYRDMLGEICKSLATKRCPYLFLGYHRHKGNQVPWQLVKTVPVVVGIHRSRLIGVIITIASFRVTSKPVKCNGFH